MASNNSSIRGFGAARKVFARPANLHLDWAASNGACSSFDYFSPVFSTSSLQNPTHPMASFHLSARAMSHPYSSFVPQSEDDCDIDASFRPTSSLPDLHLSSKRHTLCPPNLMLKAGTLSWRRSVQAVGRRGALTGFEKAFRRRPAGRDLVTDREQEVLVALERNDPVPTEPGLMSWNFDSSTSQQFASKKSFIASPGAKDPSVFDNKSLLSFRSRAAPSFLSDQSRWVPPQSWDVFDTFLKSNDSQLRSPASSASDPLQTPRTSQPCSVAEPGIYLNLYRQDLARAQSTLHRSLLMRIRITRSSTVEMQSCPLEMESLDNSMQLRRKQLVITGEEVGLSAALTLPQQESKFSNRGPANAVCILSSANMADLNEWLDIIDAAIDHHRHVYTEERDTRRSSRCLSKHQSDMKRSMSASILEMPPLLVQRGGHRKETGSDEGKSPQTTPTVVSRSLSSPNLPCMLAEDANGYNHGPLSDLSMSAFIDCYTSMPDWDATDSESSPPTASDALYSFEDAYASIIRRFDDGGLQNPLTEVPTAPFDEFARSARLGPPDVPVSPSSSEADQDVGNTDVRTPSSPLDPWLSYQAARSVSSFSSSSFADDTVMQIFAEGFQRRASSCTGS